jgi:Domain of unknown function DUF29
MAKVAERPDAAKLYQADFAAWAEQQARLLKERRFDELDLEHLIEEVADLATNQRHAVLSRARRILQHFLKLEYSPATWPRRGWQETIVTQRTDLEERLSATLRRDLEAGLADVYGRARRDAAKDLRRDKVAEAQLPQACPYTLAQILDPDWLPNNRHGLDDENTGTT